MSSRLSPGFCPLSQTAVCSVSPPSVGGETGLQLRSVPLLLYPGRVPGGLYARPYLPYLGPVYECPFEPAFIQKRNERERQRVRCVNQGYATLRNHLPAGHAHKRMSKVETLRAAIRYIKHLQRLVEQWEEGRGHSRSEVTGGSDGETAPISSAHELHSDNTGS
ncbi:achaete-scute homolog 5-like [Hoplias malabaricus]|uniref:achaete-scute homolog 5-like n=1 Tax=Hoplias malabaricus TaxID=27720 RepID=UPI0034620B84